MVNFLRVKAGDSPRRPYPSHSIVGDSRFVRTVLFETIEQGWDGALVMKTKGEGR